MALRTQPRHPKGSTKPLLMQVQRIGGERMFAVGGLGGAGVVLRSDDGGKTATGLGRG